MLMQIVIMLSYADMGKWSYYAQNYASIVCQGLLMRPRQTAQFGVKGRA